MKYHILLPRADQVGTPIDNAHWVAILMSTSGYEPYHKSRVVAEVGVAVADFLIYDPLFPRSVLRCLRECQQAAHAISRRPFSECVNEVETSVRDLILWLEHRAIDELVRTGLHEALTYIVNQVHQIGQSIDRVYFSAAMQLAQPGPASDAPAESRQGSTQSQSQG